MFKDRYIYPAVFSYADNGISVSFPDLPGCLTAGNNDEEALLMGKEAMALHLFGMEEDQETIPDPTPTQALKVEDHQAVILLEVWMPPFRHEMRNKSIKKALTVLRWMDDIAREHNINYSHLLQDALSEHLKM
ncbi:type II toxin-antitoxin system HicB family antitoxin [Virgibacillus sp. NKC19-3]|uniref:type II toxin-antitoxin system HicB family antitoxin n=1 Tax=Virgibacillus saliphilus TaxID=2831674 RepID=UPI001C9BA083|nr:type II toxin-antitoxin system HicB family antitoxin [Virgibacillus sp. NKC19-3]MBY7141628.1 type II toxin-antitoxin system HicB family antitoxin [Virgibacillus sp. NKC19-3]